jgi:hypothetical protein
MSEGSSGEPTGLAAPLEGLRRALREAEDDLRRGNVGRGIRRVYGLHHSVDRATEQLEAAAPHEDGMCCYIEPVDGSAPARPCREAATYAIRDLGDPHHPDSFHTEACARHVGEILGHRVDAGDIKDIWEVEAL